MSEKTTTDKIIEAVKAYADNVAMGVITIEAHSLAIAIGSVIGEQDKIDLAEIKQEAEKPENAGSDYTKNHMPGAWHNRREGFINGAKWVLNRIGYTLADLTQKTKEDGK